MGSVLLLYLYPRHVRRQVHLPLPRRAISRQSFPGRALPLPLSDWSVIEPRARFPALGYTVTYAVGNTLLTIWGMVLIILFS